MQSLMALLSNIHSSELHRNMRKIWEKYDPVTRQTLGACFLAFFFNGVLTMMIGSALPDMKAAYGINDTQAGLMLSGHSAGNLIACFLSGLVPLWLGKRKSITVLSAIAAIGFLMMLASGNPIWLVVAFILTGIGRGSISNFNNGTVNLVTAGSPTAINLLHSFFAIGAISAPLFFLLANRLSGWRAAILLTVALGVTVSFNFSRLHLTNDRPDRTDHRQKSMLRSGSNRSAQWLIGTPPKRAVLHTARRRRWRSATTCALPGSDGKRSMRGAASPSVISPSPNASQKCR